MPSPAGAGVGLVLGLGVLLVASWLRARRPLSVLERIGPFVGRPGAAPAAVLDRTVGLTALAARLSAGGGDTTGLVDRLRFAGAVSTPAQYRLERLAWAGTGAVAGFGLGVLPGSTGTSPAISLVLAGTGAVAGWFVCDARLRHRGRARQGVIAGQLPMLADLVALAVSAGATPVAALEAAGAVVSGPMGEEVEIAASGIRSGAAVDTGLRAFAAATGLPVVHRFIDALVLAIELGSPLAEVARAQAADIRSDERRRLMESAGRKDVAMLVPIVFLVLPSVVLIAVFPGVQSLHLVVP